MIEFDWSNFDKHETKRNETKKKFKLYFNVHFLTVTDWFFFENLLNFFFILWWWWWT